MPANVAWKWKADAYRQRTGSLICRSPPPEAFAEWWQPLPRNSGECGIYNPTLSGLDSHTMMLSCSMLLVDRQALSEHTTTSSSTKSLGQALRVSLVKPGAYLSESYYHK